MTVELKSCPFCGNSPGLHEVEVESCGHNEIFNYRVECSCCIRTMSLSDKNKAINTWNTRQPQGCDWKPIKNIYHDSSITRDTNLILYDAIQKLFDHYIANIFINDEEHVHDIERNYTHYALLTPPEGI